MNNFCFIIELHIYLNTYTKYITLNLSRCKTLPQQIKPYFFSLLFSMKAVKNHIKA